MIERSIQVSPDFEVATLVNKANQFKSRISLVADEKTANAKSIMGIISMDLQNGGTITIMADGEDEQQVLPELESILANPSA